MPKFDASCAGFFRGEGAQGGGEQQQAAGKK